MLSNEVKIELSYVTVTETFWGYSAKAVYSNGNSEILPYHSMTPKAAIATAKFMARLARVPFREENEDGTSDNQS